MTATTLVLFDLGGVLVRLGGVGAMGRLAGIEAEDEVWRRWLTCAWVRRFERGWCSADEFAAGVVADWALTIGPDDFLSRFADWPEGTYDGALELVEEVRARVRVGCLSNTNALHWERHAATWSFTEQLDVRFLSHELGMLKPDAELFAHVAAAVGVPPGEVLFLDDNLLNVDGARAAGFAAAHVRGVDEARAALVDAGVLPGQGQRDGGRPGP